MEMRVPRRMRIYNPEKEMETLATEYKQLKRQQEAIQAQLDETKAIIIEMMNGAEEAVAGVYKVRNKQYESARLNTEALKAVHPDIYKLFSKTSTSTRFTID